MIKAIETNYKGCKFRSRLEARWAVFADTLNAPWVYEPQGFDLGEVGWYLPDFWFPINKGKRKKAGYWVEIKPDLLSNEEEQKCAELAIQSGHNVVVLAGNPWPGEFCVYKFLRLTGKMVEVETDSSQDWPVIAYPFASQNETNEKFEEAYKAARSARFEHGETPIQSSVKVVGGRKLVTAADLRGALLASIEAVLEGRINVAQANAVVGLSGELHKSIRQEWDMRVYANENLDLSHGKVIELIGGCDE